MRHLILFATTKWCNIRVKWIGWQKEQIRQVMIWQLWMQLPLGMLNSLEQMFTVVCYTRCAHYLWGVGDKVGKLSRWKPVVLTEIEDVVNKKKLYFKFSEYWRLMSSSCSCLFTVNIKRWRKILKMKYRACPTWTVGWCPPTINDQGNLTQDKFATEMKLRICMCCITFEKFSKSSCVLAGSINLLYFSNYLKCFLLLLWSFYY